MDISPADISAIGKPCKASGISANSSFSLTPDSNIKAKKNPNEAPTAFVNVSIKLYPSWIFNIVTPKTTQLVVISGKILPLHYIK